MKMGFIGVGAMAGAMLQAALASGYLQPEDVVLYDTYDGALQKFSGVAAAGSAREAAAACDVLQLGVKPQDMPGLLEEIGILREPQLLLSIAAGVPLQTFRPHAARAVRLMPNINAAVGQAVTAYCGTAQATPEQLRFVAGYCACFGRAIALDEKYFSAFVAIAGSAPAFVFLFIDELARAGVSAGLPRALALEIAAQTVLGSAKLLQESNRHPCALADSVCSPAGTTIAGVNKLREHGFAHAISQAALAAYERDKALLELHQDGK
jgi:pyrroline-5-carboxylate reductase